MTRATMRCAVLAAPGRFELRECPRPEPAAGEVRIALEGCGVCGSDLPVWEGRPWFDYPREPGAPGHEGWGRVDAIGAGVDRIREGDRVAALCFRAYAEYEVAAADMVVALPAALSDRPFPAEPLACAVNVLRRARVSPGMRLAVVGTGFLGATLVGLAAARGARVAAISRRDTSLRAARSMGAETVIAAGERAEAHVREWSEGAMCDIVIEASGVQPALDLATTLVRTRGTLVLAGFHQDGPRTVDMQRWNWEGLDVINAHEREPGRYVAGMIDAIAAVVEGELDPMPLYTHRFALAEIDEAFAVLRDRPEGFVKALVRP